MTETILSILAALLTIFIANILMTQQAIRHKKTNELRARLDNDVEEALTQFVALTGEEPSDQTIIYLEERIKEINIRLQSIPKKRSYVRRIKRVKSKKNFAND